MIDLSVIEPGHYFMDGSYGISEARFPMPLQSQFTVELMPNVLEIDGTWQQHSGRPTYGFKLQLVRDHTSQSQTDVVITGSLIGELRGRAALGTRSFELLASDATKERLLCLRIAPAEKSGLFEVSGFVSLGPSQHHPFNGRIVPTEGRAALSNVVSLPGRVA